MLRVLVLLLASATVLNAQVTFDRLLNAVQRAVADHTGEREGSHVAVGVSAALHREIRSNAFGC